MKYVRATPEEVSAILGNHQHTTTAPKQVLKRMCSGYPGCKMVYCEHSVRHDTKVFLLDDDGSRCYCHQWHPCKYSKSEVICGILPHKEVENE